MIKNRSRTVRAAVVAGVMALLLGPAAAAQAAVGPVNFNITSGSLSVSGQTLPLPGGTIAGDWDDVSGAFSGTITIPDSVIEDFSVDLGGGLVVAVDISLTFTQGLLVGTVPPDGTPGEVTTAITVGITVPDLISCTLGPVELALATTLDAATGVLTASGSDFLIPGASCTDPNSNALIDEALGLPAEEGTAISLTAELGEKTEETTTTTTTAAPAATAAATPKFTG